MLSKTSSISTIIQVLEYSDPIDNIIQFILGNFSNFHSLNPPQKEVIERMVDLVQFWFIGRPNLYRMPRAQYLTSDSETHTKETKVHTLSN